MAASKTQRSDNTDRLVATKTANVVTVAYADDDDDEFHDDDGGDDDDELARLAMRPMLAKVIQEDYLVAKGK